MSAASRCRTCAVCGAPLRADEPTNIEPIIETGYPVRYVAAHWKCSTYPTRKIQREMKGNT